MLLPEFVDRSFRIEKCSNRCNPLCSQLVDNVYAAALELDVDKVGPRRVRHARLFVNLITRVRQDQRGVFKLRDAGAMVIDERGVMPGPERRVTVELVQRVARNRLRVCTSAVQFIAYIVGLLEVAAVGRVFELDFALAHAVQQATPALSVHWKRSVEHDTPDAIRKLQGDFGCHHRARVMAGDIGDVNTEMVEHRRYDRSPVLDCRHKTGRVGLSESRHVDADGPYAALM